MKPAHATTCLSAVIFGLFFWVGLPNSKGQSAGVSKKSDIPAATAEEMRQLNTFLSRSPQDPAALFSLAMDYATIGNQDRAIELMERMSKAHAGLDPKAPAGRPFMAIENHPRFRALITQIEKENPPVIRSSRAFVIHERDLAPEGIAYDPVERKIYVSSISKRKIVCISADGSISDFKTSGQDGLGETLGMKVDARRRFLWVVSDSFAPGGAPGENLAMPDTDEHEGVFQYDLKTGALRFKHLLPAGSAGFLNDVALGPSGEAFTTNSGTGEVFRISPYHDGVEQFLPAQTVPQANGIVVSDDGRVLFVAGWLGVARVDIASKQIQMLAKPLRISDAGLDGMYFFKGTLVGIQNPDVHPGRVMRYYLNPAMDTIERAEVLESYNPVFEVPTTGTLVDDALYFVANTQVDKLKAHGVMPPANQLLDIVVVKLELR
jgi:sugar lactone lactonase YvrE